MNDLVVLVTNEIESSVYDEIDAIKKAGIKNVFIQWYNKEVESVSQELIYKYIKKQKLNIPFAHLGYKNINDIWEEGKSGDVIIEGFINDLDIMKEKGINLVIVHLTSKSVAPAYGEVGLKRLKKLVKHAEENNMKIAFENTKIPGYIDYVLENIQSKNVGFCFDSGHFHAHFKDKFNWDLVKNRIFAVHLHDNFGMEDEHLNPFDGTVNWEMVIEKLSEANYDGPITLEIYYQKEYAKKSIEEFYCDARKIGLKLEEMRKNANK